VGADDRSHARPRHQVDGDPRVLEDVEDPDVRHPPGGTAPERDPNAAMGEVPREALECAGAPRLIGWQRDDIVSGQGGTGAGPAVVDERDPL
jgi:hypothetical protein